MAATVDFLKYQKQLNRIEATSLSQKNVFTFEEACLFTGLSKSFLYKLTSRQEVPHYKPNGKLIYFERVQLEGWLLQNPVSTIEEIGTQAQKYCMSNKKGGNK